MAKKNMRLILLVIMGILSAILIVKFFFIGFKEEVVLTVNGIETIYEDLGLYYFLGLVATVIGLVLIKTNPRFEDTSSQKKLDEMIKKNKKEEE